jgi:hypothetical protein
MCSLQGFLRADEDGDAYAANGVDETLFSPTIFDNQL